MLAKKTDRVQVYIRTKPTSQFADKLLELDSARQTVKVHLPPHPTRGHIDNQQLDFSFSVDGLLHNASQEEVGYGQFATRTVRYGHFATRTEPCCKQEHIEIQ